MYVGQSPPTAHLNDVAAAFAPLEDGAVCPLEYEIKYEYDDTAVSVSFTYVAFTSHASSVADMSDYWVVDCASSRQNFDMISWSLTLPLGIAPSVVSVSR
jgi:hypothetical protein